MLDVGGRQPSSAGRVRSLCVSTPPGLQKRDEPRVEQYHKGVGPTRPSVLTMIASDPDRCISSLVISAGISRMGISILFIVKKRHEAFLKHKVCNYPSVVCVLVVTDSPVLSRETHNEVVN